MHCETIVAPPLALIIDWEGGVIKALHLKWSQRVTPDTTLSPMAEELAAALRRYVAGEDPQWPDLPLDVTGLPPFRRSALTALKEKVKYGTVQTYAELAAMAGSPQGARAAGQAMRNNPWPLVYPCHRINGADGKLTGFGGRNGDLTMKEWLQAHERRHKK